MVHDNIIYIYIYNREYINKIKEVLIVTYDVLYCLYGTGIGVLNIEVV